MEGKNLIYITPITDERLATSYVRQVQAILDGYDPAIIVNGTELSIYSSRSLTPTDENALDDLFSVEPVGLELSTDWGQDDYGQITFTVIRFGQLSADNIVVVVNDQDVHSFTPSSSNETFQLTVARAGDVSIYVRQTGGGYQWYSNILTHKVTQQAILQVQQSLPMTYCLWRSDVWSASVTGTQFKNIHNAFRLAFRTKETVQLFHTTLMFNVTTNAKTDGVKFRLIAADQDTGNVTRSKVHFAIVKPKKNTVSFATALQLESGHNYIVRLQWAAETNTALVLEMSPSVNSAGLILRTPLGN